MTDSIKNAATNAVTSEAETENRKASATETDYDMPTDIEIGTVDEVT